MPNSRTSPNTMTLPSVAPARQMSVPSNAPKAKPAASSSGSPGMTATIT